MTLFDKAKAQAAADDLRAEDIRVANDAAARKQLSDAIVRSYIRAHVLLRQLTGETPRALGHTNENPVRSTRQPFEDTPKLYDDGLADGLAIGSYYFEVDGAVLAVSCGTYYQLHKHGSGWRFPKPQVTLVSVAAEDGQESMRHHDISTLADVAKVLAKQAESGRSFEMVNVTNSLNLEPVPEMVTETERDSRTEADRISVDNTGYRADRSFSQMG